MDFSHGNARLLAVAVERLARTSGYWPHVVSALFAVVAAYELAAVAGALVAALNATNVGAVEPIDASAVAPPALEQSRDGLRAAHLFGEIKGSAVETAAGPGPPLEAPATTLDVRLTGILFTAGGRPSQAIVAGQGREKTYRIGDALDGASGVTLRAVLTDRAILEREGRFESLRLPNELSRRTPSAAPAAIAAAPPSTPLTEPRNADAGATVAAAPAAAAPLRLSEIMLVGPQLDETGKAAGFALSPGRNITAFNELGLQSGERVIDVNGVTLGRDPNEGPRIFRQALGSATSASLTVMRDDNYETILVDSGQLSN